MRCSLCSIAYQFVVNLLLILDKLANTLLLGNPNDTLSLRFSRAADAGERWAKLVCRILGWFSPNHCKHAEQHGSRGKEIWHWSK